MHPDERSDAVAPAPFVYDDAALPVRDDLVAAHRRTWDYLAGPGTWWTGAERVAIAAEVRGAPACALCRARKDALSPYAVPGTHDRAGDALLETAVDVVHRVVTDPARLARPWGEAAQAELGDGRYVELIGVLVSVLSIDAFHRGIGRPAEALPTPQAGAPARRRPPAAVRGEAWVAMIPAGGLTAAERDLWTMRHPPNVLRALSLVPDEVLIPHAASLRQGFPHCARFPTAASRRSLGRVSVPVWLVTLSRQLPVVALVSRYLTN